MIKKIRVLFEDEFLLAAEKWSGVPIHETRDKSRPHFQGILEKQVGKSLVLFHRLDADTSGVVLFGKDPSINQKVTDLFRERKITKIYRAVVEGRFVDKNRKIEGYIVPLNSRGRFAVSAKGKASEKSLTVLNSLEDGNLNLTRKNSLIEALPFTGRTHQIRVHCSSVGFPICGDRLYGTKSKQNFPMALHAHSLEFSHPVTEKKILLTSVTPDYFEYWINKS